MLFSLAIDETILMRTSAEQVPPLYRDFPMHLKLVTSSDFWPFMLISARMLLVLSVMILLFCVLTSIPYAVALSTSLLVKPWSLPLLPPKRSMSLANRGLHMGLPPMEMDVWWPWGVSCMIISMNKLNRMGESKHSWQIPIIVLKNSPSWLFKRTAPAKSIETKATTMLTSCCWSPDKQAIYRLLGVVRASQLLISWNLSCGWCQFVFWVSVVD